MPTVTPIDLTSAVPLTGADIQSAISSFLGIGVIGSLLLLGVGWTWGPRIFRKLGGLFKRG